MRARFCVGCIVRCIHFSFFAFSLRMGVYFFRLLLLYDRVCQLSTAGALDESRMYYVAPWAENEDGRVNYFSFSFSLSLSFIVFVRISLLVFFYEHIQRFPFLTNSPSSLSPNTRDYIFVPSLPPYNIMIGFIDKLRCHKSTQVAVLRVSFSLPIHVNTFFFFFFFGFISVILNTLRRR